MIGFAANPLIFTKLLTGLKALPHPDPKSAPLLTLLLVLGSQSARSELLFIWTPDQILDLVEGRPISYLVDGLAGLLFSEGPSALKVLPSGKEHLQKLIKSSKKPMVRNTAKLLLLISGDWRHARQFMLSFNPAGRNRLPDWQVAASFVGKVLGESVKSEDFKILPGTQLLATRLLAFQLRGSRRGSPEYKFAFYSLFYAIHFETEGSGIYSNLEKLIGKWERKPGRPPAPFGDIAADIEHILLLFRERNKPDSTCRKELRRLAYWEKRPSQ